MRLLPGAPAVIAKPVLTSCHQIAVRFHHEAALRFVRRVATDAVRLQDRQNVGFVGVHVIREGDLRALERDGQRAEAQCSETNGRIHATAD